MRLANVAVSMHATEVQPRKKNMQDMAGGTEIGLIYTAPIGLEEKTHGDAGSISSLGADEPTEEERHTLRHVSDKLPWSAFLVAVIELCERFAYYGLSGPFQNYIQNSYHDPSGLPGAIGRARCFLKNLYANHQNTWQFPHEEGPLTFLFAVLSAIRNSPSNGSLPKKRLDILFAVLSMRISKRIRRRRCWK